MRERALTGHGRVTRALCVCAVAAVFAVTGSAALALRPDLTQSGGFLFGDEGHNLWMASTLAHGGRIAADVFTPYGPLTAWTYAAAASTFGNSPLVFRALNLLLTAAALVFITLTLLRYGPAWWAAAWSIIALAPMLLGLGPILGGLTVSTYTGLERLIVAATLFTWRPPDSRSPRRSLMLGALAASCQWAKFGTAAVVLVALIAADLVGAPRLRATLWVIAGAVAVQLILIAWAVFALPAPLAFETLWPVYLLESYEGLAPELRWPPVWKWKVLAAYYGPAVAGIGLVLAAFALRSRSAALQLALLLVAAYLAGSVGTFRAGYHFRQYAWMLAAAGGFAAIHLGWRWRTMAIAVSLTAWLVIGRTIAAAPDEFEWLSTPAAGMVAVTPDEARRSVALSGLARDAALTGQTILVMPNAAGWHAAFDIAVPGRHAWFVRGAVRPWEEAAVIDGFRRVSAVALCPGAEIDQLSLPPAVGRAVAASFPVRTQAADCVVFGRRASAQ